MFKAKLIGSRPLNQMEVAFHRERALRRLRWWMWRFVGMVHAALEPVEIVQHESPERRPIGRDEWEKHYWNSPKIL
jgi:hypothetical protein